MKRPGAGVQREFFDGVTPVGRALTAQDADEPCGGGCEINLALLVVGTVEGADAELTVEAGPKYSVMSMSLRFTKIGRWIHVVTQLVIAMFAVFVIAPSSIIAFYFFMSWLMVAALGSLVATGLTFLVARNARVKAEKAFEIQANRAARMLSATSVDSSQGVTETSERSSDLNQRLRHEH